MTHRNYWIALLTTLFVVALCAFKPAEPTPLTQDEDEFGEIERIVESIAREATQSGEATRLSVLLAIGSEVRHQSAWGEPESGRDTTERGSSYRIGGLLPTFISTAVLQLADQRKLSLDDKLTKHFPELENAKGVLVRHLLAHTSGLADFSGFIDDDELDGEHLVAWLKGQDLEVEPGHCFTYSLSNVLLAGALVERVAESKLEEYITRVVFNGAKMSATEWCWEGPKVDEQSFSGQDGPGGLIQSPSMAYIYGAAGLCSTTDDLFRWQRSLENRTLLEDDSYVEFTSPIRLADGSSSYFGCGAYVTRVAEFEGYSSGGTMAGFRAHTAYYPDFELTIILLAEGDEVPLPAIEARMARAVLDVEDPELRDLPLDTKEKQRYVGSYFIGCTQVLIQDPGEGKHLEALWSSDRELELLYQGRHVFVSAEDADVSLVFDMGEENAKSFLLRERGTETIAKRLN